MEKEKPGKYGRPKRQSRKRKRVFRGNQHSVNPQLTPDPEETEEIPVGGGSNEEVVVSVSRKKLKLDSAPSVVLDEVGTINIECNIIVNTSAMIDFFQKLCKCPDCGGGIEIIHDVKKKKGLAHILNTKCSSCNWSDNFCTSKFIEPEQNTKGRKAHEINVRSCIAFREIGKGYEGLRSVCKSMNIPPPMQSNVFRDINNTLHSSYNSVATESMQTASKEIPVEADEDNVKDVTASFDGTWQKRGYASLNGVVGAISHGKIVDYAVISKVCPQCRYWHQEGRRNTPEFDDWKREHHCPINHKGSAGSMESNGVPQICGRSVEERYLGYTTYLGDGDSKSFQDVVKAAPYPSKTLDKDECVGHVQKRVTAHLNTLKQKYKGVVLADGKKVCGAGRPALKTINTLQKYYGMVIRQNVGDLYGMKKGIAAIIFHCSENKDDEERHKFCPRDAKSWCKYQREKASLGSSTYKPKINLPTAVSEVVKKVFSHEDLGSDQLLKRCLHGKTQNVNESFNGVIWKKVPKDVFVCKKTLEIGVASATITYNDGGNGLLKVFKKCGFEPGHFTELGYRVYDKRRVSNMHKKVLKKGIT